MYKEFHGKKLNLKENGQFLDVIIQHQNIIIDGIFMVEQMILVIQLLCMMICIFIMEKQKNGDY